MEECCGVPVEVVEYTDFYSMDRALAVCHECETVTTLK